MGSLELEEVRGWIAQGAHGRPRTGLRWVATDAEGSALVTEPEFWNEVVALTPSAGGHAIVAKGTAKQVVIALHPHRSWRVASPILPHRRSGRACRSRSPASSALRGADRSFSRRSTPTSTGRRSVRRPRGRSGAGRHRAHGDARHACLVLPQRARRLTATADAPLAIRRTVRSIRLSRRTEELQRPVVVEVSSNEFAARTARSYQGLALTP
jgi:hypothetical protein